MKKIMTVFMGLAMCCFLSISTPVVAQDGDRTNRTEVDDDDDDMDYGWIGLIGLVGLLGLRKKDRDDRDYNTTTTRPGNVPR